MIKHPSANMTGDAHDGLIAVALFGKFRNRMMSEIVEPQAFQPSLFAKLPPRRVL